MQFVATYHSLEDASGTNLYCWWMWKPRQGKDVWAEHDWISVDISSILYESDPADMTFGYGQCQGCQGERRATDDLGELCDFPHATHPSLRNVALVHPDGHGHPTQQDSKGANHQTPLYQSFWYWMIWYIINRHSSHAWKGVCGIRHWWFYWTILECWMFYECPEGWPSKGWCQFCWSESSWRTQTRTGLLQPIGKR